MKRMVKDGAKELDQSPSYSCFASSALILMLVTYNVVFKLLCVLLNCIDPLLFNLYTPSVLHLKGMRGLYSQHIHNISCCYHGHVGQVYCSSSSHDRSDGSPSSLRVIQPSSSASPYATGPWLLVGILFTEVIGQDVGEKDWKAYTHEESCRACAAWPYPSHWLLYEVNTSSALAMFCFCLRDP